MIKINNKEIETNLFPNNELLLKTDYLNTLEEPFNINFSFYKTMEKRNHKKDKCKYLKAKTGN